MILTRSDIKHLAELARLHVSEDEAERLSRDLTEIVGFIDRASDGDDPDVRPMIRPSTEGALVRDDAPNTAITGRTAGQAARTEDGFVRTSPVGGMNASVDSGGEHSDSRGESSA